LIEAEAIIPGMRNTGVGVKNRSNIIAILIDHSATTKEISERIGLSRNGVLYHLRLLRRVGVVSKIGRYWRATLKQRKINDYL